MKRLLSILFILVINSLQADIINKFINFNSMICLDTKDCYSKFYKNIDSNSIAVFKNFSKHMHQIKLTAIYTDNDTLLYKFNIKPQKSKENYFLEFHYINNIIKKISLNSYYVNNSENLSNKIIQLYKDTASNYSYISNKCLKKLRAIKKIKRIESTFQYKIKNTIINNFIIKSSNSIKFCEIKSLKMGEKCQIKAINIFDFFLNYYSNSKSIKTYHRNNFNYIKSKVPPPPSINKLKEQLYEILNNKIEIYKYIRNLNESNVNSKLLNLLYSTFRNDSIIGTKSKYINITSIEKLSKTTSISKLIYIYENYKYELFLIHKYDSSEWKIIDLMLIKHNIELPSEITSKNYNLDLKILDKILNKTLLNFNKDNYNKTLLSANTKPNIQLNYRSIHNNFIKLREQYLLDNHFDFRLNLKHKKNYKLYTKKIDNRIFINTHNLNIPLGAEILEINKILTKNIINIDSMNKTDSIFSNKNNTIIYANVNNLELKYRHKDSLFVQNIKKTNTPVIQFSKLSNSNIIKLKNFNWNENNKIQLYNYFDSIQSKNLILDIRENRGGSITNALTLLNIIKHKRDSSEIHIHTDQNKNNSPIKIFSNVNVLNKESQNNLHIYKKIIDTNKYTYKFKFGNDIKIANKIYLLVNEHSFSSAIIFSYLFDFFNIGKIIGVSPLNTTHNIFGGNTIIKRLPNTKIDISIPRYKFNFSNKLNDFYNDKPLPIDITISDSLRLENFLQGKDAELEEALKLIREKNEQ
jgi:hypothetical protein